MQKDSSNLVGRMKVNAKPATKRKTQKSTGSTTAQSGTKSDGEFQMLSGSGSKKQEPLRRSGSGKGGIVTRPLSENQWNRVISV